MASIPNDIRRDITDRVTRMQDVTIAFYQRERGNLKVDDNGTINIDTDSDDDDDCGKTDLMFWVSRNSSAEPFRVTFGEVWYEGEPVKRTFEVRTEAALRLLLDGHEDRFPICLVDPDVSYNVIYFQGNGDPPVEFDECVDYGNFTSVGDRCWTYEKFVEAVIALVANY